MLERELARIAGEFAADLSCLPRWVYDAALSLTAHSATTDHLVLLSEWVPTPDAGFDAGWLRSLTDEQLRVYYAAVQHMRLLDAEQLTPTTSAVVDAAAQALYVALRVRDLPRIDDVYDLVDKPPPGEVLVSKNELEAMRITLRKYATHPMLPHQTRKDLNHLSDLVTEWLGA